MRCAESAHTDLPVSAAQLHQLIRVQEVGQAQSDLNNQQSAVKNSNICWFRSVKVNGNTLKSTHLYDYGCSQSRSHETGRFVKNPF